MMTDFPKIHCPFLRQTFKVNQDQWKEHGSRLKLRTPEVYLVVDRVNPDYEWVFEDPDTTAVEKLDGTNIKILLEKGRLLEVQNRKNVIDPLQIMHGKTFIMEGIFRSLDKGYVKADGVVFYNLKRKEQGQIWMAKLRRDMFDWFYSDRIAIEGYTKEGTDKLEDQEKFD